MITDIRNRGVNEVGHVDDSSVDQNWGKTQEDGVTLQWSLTTVDLRSAQVHATEESAVQEATPELQIPLIVSELQVFQRMWGIPESQLTGDLSAGTPTEEKLEIRGQDIGSEELTLYVLGPGPTSTRRIDMPRAKVTNIGSVQMGSNGYVMPAATWRGLAPKDSSPLITISDQP